MFLSRAQGSESQGIRDSTWSCLPSLSCSFPLPWYTYISGKINSRKTSEIEGEGLKGGWEKSVEYFQ